ncbi:uncharacterized protein LOC129059681 [Pongo abelii]|uniref:uncharacterized protein LOC129059681 n=1 Tax=Pongo abelii TaxID=9601 RepID=UPI0030076BA2
MAAAFWTAASSALRVVGPLDPADLTGHLLREEPCAPSSEDSLGQNWKETLVLSLREKPGTTASGHHGSPALLSRRMQSDGPAQARGGPHSSELGGPFRATDARARWLRPWEELGSRRHRTRPRIQRIAAARRRRQRQLLVCEDGTCSRLHSSGGETMALPRPFPPRVCLRRSPTRALRLWSAVLRLMAARPRPSGPRRLRAARSDFFLWS